MVIMKKTMNEICGLSEISLEEAMLDGGVTIYYYDGSNGMNYAINAVVNGCKYAYHFINNLFGGDDEIVDGGFIH